MTWIGNVKKHFLFISFKSGGNSLFSLAGYRIRCPVLLTESRLVRSSSTEEKTRMRKKKVGNVFSPMAFSQADNFSGFKSPHHNSKSSTHGKRARQERIAGLVIQSHHSSAGFLILVSRVSFLILFLHSLKNIFMSFLELILSILLKKKKKTFETNNQASYKSTKLVVPAVDATIKHSCS